MSATLMVKRGGYVVEGVLIALIVLLMIGCRVGPDYKRPAVNIPGSYRQALAPDTAPASQAPSIAGEQWTAVFQDATLQRLIQDALANSLDLRIAAQPLRVVEIGSWSLSFFPSVPASYRRTSSDEPVR